MKARISHSNTREPSRFGKDRWIPWAFVAGFLVILAANGGLIYFALASWPGLTTDHAYDEGLAYNKVLDKTEREAKLGWTLAIDFISDGKDSKRGKLIVRAKDKNGQPHDGLVIEAELVRPVEPIPATSIELKSGSGGLYVAAVTFPRAGQWDIYLAAKGNGQTYHTGRRILVP